VPGAVLRESDKREFMTFSDEKGKFQFAPLPVGKYYLSANTDPPLWAEEGDIDVKPHSCSAIDFQMVVDAAITGTLTGPSGVPLAVIEVAAVIFNEDQDATSTWTDTRGKFELHALAPGDYVLKIKLQSEP
jgi:hypothetical protein